jgi:hypothetical protein
MIWKMKNNFLNQIINIFFSTQHTLHN